LSIGGLGSGDSVVKLSTGPAVIYDIERFLSIEDDAAVRDAAVRL
jgi:hypothetical protein